VQSCSPGALGPPRAAALDAKLQATGALAGPLHGVVFAIKDQCAVPSAAEHAQLGWHASACVTRSVWRRYDTFDMRTTSGADVAYADDRPPRDATFVQRLRDAGAIVLGKTNLGGARAHATPTHGVSERFI
jgi:amidase